MILNKTNVGLLTCLIGLWQISLAQKTSLSVPKPNWYNLDLNTDQMFGISMEKSYSELLRTKNPKTVIVAVIDGGLDITHEDIKDKLWTNVNEVSDNGIDDDNNGYIDDIHGWNFLGSKHGSFEYDNYQLVRDVRKYLNIFGSMDSLKIRPEDLALFRTFKSKKLELDSKVAKLTQETNNLNLFLQDADLIIKRLGTDNISKEDLRKFGSFTEEELQIRNYLLSVLKDNDNLKQYLDQTKAQLSEKKIDLEYRLNLSYDPRSDLAEIYKEGKNRFYGNGNVAGSVAPAHGTHVAGIIGAERNNGIGINGIAEPAIIMAIRAIPDGDGLDVDEANAIRYAVDNGAKIINMSFGLTVNSERKLVQQAVNYALSKDVLFIQAAGNGHDDLDQTESYPNRFNNKDHKFVDSFIKVAASGFTDGDSLVVPFSNFGKRSVDVFAPGLGIESTVPGNKYEAHSGTSMAAPVVSGLAAVIRAYYPKLSAPQVKEIIVRSVVKRSSLSELCVTSGLINAYQALQLAAKY